MAQHNHVYLGEDKHYYSAPYQYIGKKLKVVYTRSMVRIFYRFNLIAVHQRDYTKGTYTTNKKHLCSTHRHYLNRSPEYYIDRAKRVSESLAQLIALVFSQNRYPEQLYRSCDGLFSLQRNTPDDTFSKACQIAIENKNYSYGFVQNLIKNKMTECDIKEPDKPLPDHKNIRGKAYYNQFNCACLGLKAIGKRYRKPEK
jgi:hypothetical protein